MLKRLAISGVGLFLLATPLLTNAAAVDEIQATIDQISGICGTQTDSFPAEIAGICNGLPSLQALLNALTSNTGQETANVAGASSISISGSLPPPSAHSFCDYYGARLKEGDSGDYVDALNEALSFSNIPFRGESMSYFDATVADNVREFQRQNDISQTGQIGPLTKAALRAALSCPIPTVSVSPGSGGTVTVKYANMPSGAYIVLAKQAANCSDAVWHNNPSDSCFWNPSGSTQDFFQISGTNQQQGITISPVPAGTYYPQVYKEIDGETDPVIAGSAAFTVAAPASGTLPTDNTLPPGGTPPPAATTPTATVNPSSLTATADTSTSISGTATNATSLRVIVNNETSDVTVSNGIWTKIFEAGFPVGTYPITVQAVSNGVAGTNLTPNVNLTVVARNITSLPVVTFTAVTPSGAATTSAQYGTRPRLAWRIVPAAGTTGVNTCAIREIRGGVTQTQSDTIRPTLTSGVAVGSWDAPAMYADTRYSLSCTYTGATFLNPSTNTWDVSVFGTAAPVTCSVPENATLSGTASSDGAGTVTVAYSNLPPLSSNSVVYAVQLIRTPANTVLTTHGRNVTGYNDSTSHSATISDVPAGTYKLRIKKICGLGQQPLVKESSEFTVTRTTAAAVCPARALATASLPITLSGADTAARNGTVAVTYANLPGPATTGSVAPSYYIQLVDQATLSAVPNKTITNVGPGSDNTKTITNVPVGTYTLQVRQSCGMTLQELVKESAPFTVDAPAAASAIPVITSFTPTAVTTGQYSNVIVNGSNFRSGAVVIRTKTSTGATVNLPTTYVSSQRIEANSRLWGTEEVGEYTFKVKNPDEDGVTGQTSLPSTAFRVAAPTLVSASIDSYTLNALPSVSTTISGRASGVSPVYVTISYSAGASQSNTLTVASDGRWTNTYTSGFSAGFHTVTVRANNSSGQILASGTLNVSATPVSAGDAVAPVITSFYPTQVTAGASSNIVINGYNFPTDAKVIYTAALSGESGELPANTIVRFITPQKLEIGPYTWNIGGVGDYSFRVVSSGNSSVTSGVSTTYFRINAPVSSTPFITSLSPSTLPAGQTTFVINGSNFDAGDTAATTATVGYSSGASYGTTFTVTSASPNQLQVNATGLAHGGAYTIYVRSADRQRNSNSVPLTVGVSPPVITINGDSTSREVNYTPQVAFGGTANITWSASGANSCSPVGTWGDDAAPSAATKSWSVSSLYTSRTYGISCTNSAGTTYKYLNVTVAPQSNTAATENTSVPVITVTPESASISSGGTVNFTWNVVTTPNTGVTACYAAGNGLGGAAGYTTIPLTSGTTPWTTPQLSANTTYGIQCSNTNSSNITSATVYKYVTVTVTTPQPPTFTSISPSSGITDAEQRNFTVTGTNFRQGAEVYYAYSGAQYLPSGKFTPTFDSATQLTFTAGPLPAGTYTLYVKNPDPDGQISGTRTVTITAAAPTPPTSHITITGSGNPYTLSWTSSNSDHCAIQYSTTGNTGPWTDLAGFTGTNNTAGSPVTLAPGSYWGRVLCSGPGGTDVPSDNTVTKTVPAPTSMNNRASQTASVAEVANNLASVLTALQKVLDELRQ